MLALRTATRYARRTRYVGQVRLFTNKNNYDAVVLDAYSDNGRLALSQSSHISNATRTSILEQLKHSNFKNAGDVRVLYNVGGVKQIAIVNLGEIKQLTQGDNVAGKRLEAARNAAATGVKALLNQGVQKIGIDVTTSAHGAAEGATLAMHSFDRLKNPKSRKPLVDIGPFLETVENVDPFLTWETGQIYGASQNLARSLMETPANLMTPKIFAEEIAYLLAGLEKVEVIVRDEEWAKRQGMNALIGVAKGSEEPLRFLEIQYKGGKEGDAPLGLVGKGVTFDAGGISLKPSNNMALMKGDMGGAATVAGALYGICKLGLPLNVTAVTPLCENLPSGRATKPGDVIKAMNGKSIEVLDTDAEGRLILADALYYLSSQHKAHSIIDLATLTGAMDVALGNVFAGVFTNSDKLWNQLDNAGQFMSDPFWRMPLHDGYLKEMTDSSVADLNNLGVGRSGGACSAAMFLKQFVSGIETPIQNISGDTNLDDPVPQTTEANDEVAWAHIDIAGVMDSKHSNNYHVKGMSGRPTRSLVELARNLAGN
ncbi:hypothetical protein VKS41_002684 [Umbelopsis sp. WA50703]